MGETLLQLSSGDVRPRAPQPLWAAALGWFLPVLFTVTLAPPVPGKQGELGSLLGQGVLLGGLWAAELEHDAAGRLCSPLSGPAASWTLRLRG